MVTVPPTAPAYAERLGIRARWWLVVLAIALFGSAELFAGFSGRVVVIVLAAFLVPTVALLASASFLVLTVDGTGIHAGRLHVGYDEIASVEALDGPQTRLRLGPEADPTARLAVRGYIRESVLVRPLDNRGIPYWLISTRHPQRVIAAVEQAARASLGR